MDNQFADLAIAVQTLSCHGFAVAISVQFTPFCALMRPNHHA